MTRKPKNLVKMPRRKRRTGERWGTSQIRSIGGQFCVNVWFQAGNHHEMFAITQCVREAAGRYEAASFSTPDGWKRDMQFRCRSGEGAISLLDKIILACPTVKGEVLT